ncbi:sigma-70 family RNA polymerase sigma factor [Algivirga pacifica]|uniref:Sigma-70 family RNA polymerase sigma factor n=1 Tax=Algivirga pacifica TaxID=1162670 RepID=A0ABP9D144_9BACT
MTTDRELWNQLRSGEETALKEIFSQYIQLLYKYGYKCCQDSALVEDAIQDLFLRLWEKRSTLGETDAIKFYLMSSLKRDLYRRMSRNKNVSLEEEHQSIDFVLDFTVEDQIVAAEGDRINKQKLEKTLNSLSKRQKEVIYLRFYLEMSPEEVSELMQISNQSVRNLQSEALKKMKSEMGGSALLYFLLFFSVQKWS